MKMKTYFIGIFLSLSYLPLSDPYLLRLIPLMQLIQDGTSHRDHKIQLTPIIL